MISIPSPFGTAGPRNAEESDFKTVPLAQLRHDVKLRCPIVDDQHVLLLSEGMGLTPQIVEKLRGRGIAFVKIHKSEFSRLYRSLGPGQFSPSAGALRRASNKVESKEVDNGLGARWNVPGRPDEVPFALEMKNPGVTTYDRVTVGRLFRVYRQAIGHADEIFGDLLSAKSTHVDAPAELAHEALKELMQDQDVFVCIGISPQIDKYPVCHSVHSSMLAMSLGAALGLGKRSLVELGVGCLLHDVGMLKINPRLLDANRVYDNLDRVELAKHPSAAYELLSSIKGMPIGASMVAYQMHERCDGSGYPRRSKGNRIHFLAKIAAVADVYVAMVSQRPHRTALAPYAAIEQILRETSAGKFDPVVVRALLETVALFPIGSRVELSDARHARVIRSNHESYTRPIVETGNVEGRSGELVDLRRATHLEIRRPLQSVGVG